jgi:hypothetical protein
VVEVAREAITALLETLELVISALRWALTRPLDLPVVTWLYESLTGQPMTSLGAGTLAVAIPGTALFKALTGRAPIPPQGAAASDMKGMFLMFSAVSTWLFLPLDAAENLLNPPEIVVGAGSAMSKIVDRIRPFKTAQTVVAQLAWALEIIVVATGDAATIAIETVWSPRGDPWGLDTYVGWVQAVLNSILVFCDTATILVTTEVSQPDPVATDASPAARRLEFTGDPGTLLQFGIVSIECFALLLTIRTRKSEREKLCWFSNLFAALLDLSKGLRLIPLNQLSADWGFPYAPWVVSMPLGLILGNVAALLAVGAGVAKPLALPDLGAREN